MQDPFGRSITYLRLSVTDRCDFRCTYCMAEQMTFLPKSEVLTLEEMGRLCQAFIELGVKKIRLSGGEPLVRKGVISLFNDIGSKLGEGGLEELALTSNASQLGRYAEELYLSGVRRINVSIDSLRAEKFSLITRGGNLSQVLNGIEIAKRVGLKIKINAVALKDFSEEELHTFVSWCGAEGFDLTFIEVMPLGEMGDLQRIDQFLPLTEVRERLSERWTLSPSTHQTGGPSRYFRVEETGQKVGFISPLTQNFCDGCNRVRVTCTGRLVLCLGHEDGVDLREVLRSSEGLEPVKKAIIKALNLKPERHDFTIVEGSKPSVARYMSTTGG
ncbi:MAG: GTP 3',8-cyclase MoaA [Alphaproteobacteria bacterium]